MLPIGSPQTKIFEPTFQCAPSDVYYVNLVISTYKAACVSRIYPNVICNNHHTGISVVQHEDDTMLVTNTI